MTRFGSRRGALSGMGVAKLIQQLAHETGMFISPSDPWKDDMDNRTDLARLQQQIDMTRTVLEQTGAMAMQMATLCFSEVLFQEKRRSERYGHCFSVVTAASDRVGVTELLNRVVGSLRGSDILGIVDGNGTYFRFGSAGDVLKQGGVETRGETMVGVILPETDREGAQNAVQRLDARMSPGEDVSIGMAVYPDDSTDLKELLAIATA